MAMKSYMRVAGVAGRMLLAFLFVFSQSAWAAQDQKTKDKADSAQNTSAQQSQAKQAPALAAKAQSEEAQSTAEARSAAEETPVAEEKSAGDGSHEGIKVHGHWTIEVHNPDGALVTHREFENSYVTGPAGNVLTLLITGQYSPGAWHVDLSGTSSAGQGGLGTIGMPGSGDSFTNLTVSVSASAQITLSGYLTIPSLFSNAVVTSVHSGIALCSPTVAPASCGTSGNPGFQFTGATLVTPIPIANGQIVQVTLAISFS